MKLSIATQHCSNLDSIAAEFERVKKSHLERRTITSASDTPNFMPEAFTGALLCGQ